MSVVNNILNKVSLNTTKYNENLQKMKKKTKAETKEIGGAFKTMGAVWTSVAGAISAGAIGSAVVKELKATETAVASFITTTGGVGEAREMFEMLQQAARDTIQPFDALQNSALDLRRNGIQPTAENLKTFTQIALSSGKSLETVTAAFTATTQGKYKALAQLGIVAKESGDKIQVTYKGVTQEIDKNTEAISGYFKKLGEENSGALEYLQSGMTGAINHLENAWGDFVRAIAESGLGDAIAHTIRAMSTALDGITAWINNNQAAIKQFFYNWSDYVDRLAKDFEGLTRDLNNFFNASQKVNGARGKSAPGVLGYINSFAETIGETWHDLINGGDAERAFKAEREREIALFKQKTANLKKGSAEYERAIYETNERQRAIAKKYEKETTSVVGRLGDFLFGYEKFSDRMDKNLNAYSEYLDKQNEKREEAEKKARERSGGADVSLTPFGTGGGSGGGGRGSAIRAAADNWSAYYTRIIDLQRNSLSERQKIDRDYFKSLDELQREAINSQSATAEQVNQVRELLEDEHQRKIKELREQAHAFYIENLGDEEAQIRESYARKLEDLKQFNDDQLITEQEFLEVRSALYEQYTKELTEQRKRAHEGDSRFFTKAEAEEVQQFGDGMNSLSEAFQNLTSSMNQSGSKYKALFAVQKAFAVASATTNAILAWSKALAQSEGGWMSAIANYASAIALTTNILSQLKGVEMHDRGGRIAAGKVGIVGEYGPELISGPANVTSRKETADLARGALAGNSVQVNLYEDASKAGAVSQTQGPDGEQIINIFVSNIRRGGQMAQTLESTYALHRFGA